MTYTRTQYPAGSGGGSALTTVALGNIGATKSQAVTGDSKLVGTLTANATLTITGMVAGGLVILDVTQDGLGPWTLDVVVSGSTVSLPVNSTGGSLFTIVSPDGTSAHAAALGAGPATTTVAGAVKLAGDLGGTSASPTVPGLATKASLVSGKVPLSQLASQLVPTAVKTSAYTAAAQDYVPVDCSSGNVTVTAPTAPTDGSRLGIKLIAVSGSFTCTIAAGGTDVFNKAAGSTTLSLSLANQAALLQYQTSTGIWYVQSTDVPLAGLDARYATSLTNPMTTPGDLIVGGTSGAAARLAKGADSQVLTVDSSTHLLAWKDPAAAPAAATASVLGTVKIVGTPSDAANPTVPAVDSNGLVQTGQLPIRPDAQKPTAALFETFSRRFAQSSGTFTTGLLILSAIALPKGTVVTSISVLPTTTGSGTHGWAALYDNSAAPALLRQSTDDASVAWTTNTIKTFTLSSTFTTTYAGIHYIGVMFVAGTMPTLVTDGASFGTANQLAPFLSNSANGSLTTTAPATATSLAAQSKQIYAYVA